MPVKAKAKSQATLPWWLEPGDEDCPHCGQPYIYELEFRCSACDGPACIHCKQLHAAGHEVCPDCVSANGE